MNWLVVVPAAWFLIALTLGLLIGRCLRVDAAPAAPTPAGGLAAPATMDAPPAGDDDQSAVSRDRSLTPTV